jgi:nucleotide-binding universal stress UspA family protein
VDALPDAHGVVPASWPGRTIVAAIEFGPRVRNDVQRAAEVARWAGARLVLAHIVPVPVMPPWFSANLDAHLRIERSKAETALDALRADLKDMRSTVCVRVGHPPDEIAAVAAEEKAGLIVMALRKRAGMFGEAAGAWAYRVLCHGVAPVLALPESR